MKPYGKPRVFSAHYERWGARGLVKRFRHKPKPKRGCFDVKVEIVMHPIEFQMP